MIRKSDWVTCKGSSQVGLVIRVARDGSWADVKWRERGLGEWSKRMQTKFLKVVTTIYRDTPFGILEISDPTRAQELNDGIKP